MKEAVARSGVDPALINYATVGKILFRQTVAMMATLHVLHPSRPAPANGICCNGIKSPLYSSGLQAIVTYWPNKLLLGDCAYGIGGGVILTDLFGVGHMGVTAENLVEKRKLTHEEQDALAVESHRCAANAIKEKRSLF